ncbi:19886_t:CDS:2, partial [Cetraspora pellucida]
TVQLPSHKKEAVQLPSDKKETIQLPSHKKETIQLPFRKKETEKDPIDVPKNPIFVPYPSLEGHSRKLIGNIVV